MSGGMMKSVKSCHFIAPKEIIPPTAHIYSDKKRTMVPVQKVDLAKDDERDDSYGWSHSGRRNFIAANERVNFMTTASNRRHGVPQYSERISQTSHTWYQSANWPTMRRDNSYRWHGRNLGMVPVKVDTTRLVQTSASVSSSLQTSRVIVPKNLTLPKEIVKKSKARETTSKHDPKKRSVEDQSNLLTAKRTKMQSSPQLEGKFHKLDLLCSATLELGPMSVVSTGCSCPKSKCVALYCDCFKAGSRCSTNCSCLSCLNTVKESGANGARSKAIQAILARNPRAFTNAGSNNAPKLLPGEQACNCIRSRCLKLYCACFQSGKTCNPSVCLCVGCLNNDTSAQRKAAIKMTLEKRPDAFHQKSRTKEIGSGCACKNNQCVKKYCECFRTDLKCTKVCSCNNCQNRSD